MILNSSGPGGISSSSSDKERVNVPVQVGTLTYNGNEQSPSWSEYDSTIIEISGETSGTNAGNYSVSFTILQPKDYIWEDGSKGPKIVQWSIGKAIVESVPSQTGTLTYNGGEQTPVWTTYSDLALEISGETSGTNAGNYTVLFTPTLNYKWFDGTETAKNVTWTIQKAKIQETPSQSGTLTYNGEEQSPQWSNYDEDKMSMTGTTVGTNAGDYTVTFTPNSNYTWQNNSSTGIDIAWTINKALSNLTLSDTNITLNADNTSKVVTVSHTGDGTITVSNSNTSLVSTSLSGNQLTISSVDESTSGQTTITVTCSDTTNYTGGSQTISVSCEFVILYTVTINADDTQGTVTGAGIYEEGTEVTISATALEGYEFTEWQLNGETITTNPYTFTINSNVMFEVVFEESEQYVSGIDWFGTTMPSSEDWYSVTYGDDKFVAISYGTKSAYSIDGINWTTTTLPSILRLITYGNGKFVAIRGSGQNSAAYSTDGINWTAKTLPSAAYWNGVTYGNGKFVAVAGGGSNKAAYSTDGITWKSATLPSSASWSGIAYGNGKFVTFTGGSLVAYSTDGITWKSSSLPYSGDWGCIAYGNGTFVILSEGVSNSGSTNALYSTDGISWTRTNLPDGANWKSATYGDGKFVAVAGGTTLKWDKVAYSEDGITWESATLPSAAYWHGVAYGDGKFVAVAGGTNISGSTTSNIAAYSSEKGPAT